MLVSYHSDNNRKEELQGYVCFPGTNSIFLAAINIRSQQTLEYLAWDEDSCYFICTVLPAS